MGRGSTGFSLCGFDFVYEKTHADVHARLPVREVSFAAFHSRLLYAENAAHKTLRATRAAQHTSMNPYWLVVGISACVQCFVFLRWLHRRARDDEIRRAFVRDMAVNHLPHLYLALRQIATRLGLELKEPPPVQFLEFTGDDQKHE